MTKIHLLANAAVLFMRTEIASEQASDQTGFKMIISDNRPTPSVLLAGP